MDIQSHTFDRIRRFFGAHLEVLAMISQYFKSGHLPVRYALGVLAIRYGYVRYPYSKDAVRQKPYVRE